MRTRSSGLSFVEDDRAAVRLSSSSSTPMNVTKKEVKKTMQKTVKRLYTSDCLSDIFHNEWFDTEPKTGYDYSKSLSYRTSDEKNSWKSPNMCRRRLNDLSESYSQGKQETTIHADRKVDHNAMCSENFIGSVTGCTDSSVDYSTVRTDSNVDYSTVRTDSNVDYSTVRTDSNVDYSTVRTDSDVDYSTVRTDSDVDYSTVRTDSNVDYSTVRTGSNVDYSTVRTGSNVDYSTVRTGSNVDYSTVRTDSNVDYSTVHTDSNVEISSIYKDKNVNYYTVLKNINADYVGTLDNINDCKMWNLDIKRAVSRKPDIGVWSLGRDRSYVHSDDHKTLNNLNNFSDSDEELESSNSRIWHKRKYFSKDYFGSQHTDMRTKLSESWLALIENWFTTKIFSLAYALCWLDTFFTSRRGCCLWFPLLLLLLLLPLLFLGLVGVVDKSSTGLFSSMLSQNRTVVEQISNYEIERLSVQFQEILLKLQSVNQNQLAREDVELIVRNIISKEMTDLILGMNEQKRQDALNQVQWKKDQTSVISDLREKLQLLNSNFETLSQELVDAKLSMKGEDDVDRNAATTQKIIDLDAHLLALNTEMSELKLAQLSLGAQMRNCCKNDSDIDLAATTKLYIDSIIAKVLSGEDGKGNTHHAFSSWLHKNYVSRSDLSIELALVSKELSDKFLALLHKEEESNKDIDPPSNKLGLSEEEVRILVEEALLKFSADKTGLPDYALESAGGSILNTRCSETYSQKTALFSVFGIPLWYRANSPRTVIQPEVNPGECWAFKGSVGYLVLKLSATVKVTAFSLEHIPKSLAPHGNIDSAPRDFSVYGLVEETDTNNLSLGNYTYDKDGKPLQYFAVQVPFSKAFKLVEVKILNNHGNKKYTCLYRFRVHGVAV